MRHCHYILQGYQRSDPNTGQLQDVATVDVIAAGEAEAIAAARELVDKPQWRVSSVVMHDPSMEGVARERRP